MAAVPQRHRSRELAAAAEHVEHFGKARIAVVQDIAIPEMCDWLIARARPGLKPARIYDDKEGRHRSGSGRTNTVCPFPGPDRDLVLAVVRARVADVTGLQVRAIESSHILHYLCWRGVSASLQHP